MSLERMNKRMKHSHGTHPQVHDGHACYSNWTTDYQQETLSQIARNADAGCLICNVHEQAITKCLPEAATDQDGTVIQRRHVLASPLQTLSCPPIKRLSSWFIEIFQDVGDFEKVDTESVAMQRAIPPGDTGAAESLRWAEDEIQHCIREHSNCGRGIETMLPSRIIDVGTVEGAQLKLQEPKVHGRYACLSHCWGNKQVTSLICTTTKNFSSHLLDIPWSTLPKTFQDTITVVRRLGLRYLWIDSLCIIQDSYTDWELEASRMASTYQNAYVTIAATTSADSTGGLFTRPEHSRWQSHELLLHGSNKADHLFARIQLNHVFDPDEIGEFPLLQRAWAYQERLLSPRVLHFAGYELNFECRQRSSCQCTGVTTLTSHPKISFASRFNSSLAWDTHGGIPGQPRRLAPHRSSSWGQHHPTSWSEIVRAYMRLKLTYPTDILPALSGMAKQWNYNESDQYLAGLWRNSLIQGLLWSVVRLRSRSDKWVAPSWSWASTGLGSSIYHNQMVIPKTWATVEGSSCLPSGPDPTGAISSGHLLLHTQILPGAIYYWPPREGKMERSTPICRLSLEHAWYHISFDYPIWEDGPGKFSSGSPVRIAAIATVQASQSGSAMLKCLVLTPNAREAETWERCGLVTIWENTVLAVSPESCLSRDGPNVNLHPDLWKADVGVPEDRVRSARLKETLELFELAEFRTLKIV